MLTAFALLLVLPALTSCSGEGNIHLLEDEVASALRSCTYNESTVSRRDHGISRRRRSDDYDYQSQNVIQLPRIDGSTKQYVNRYGHERRNSTNEMYVLNGTENNTAPMCGRTNSSVKYVRTITSSRNATHKFRNRTRSKRSSSLIDNSDHDQCLSQCVFANLQVVDRSGIPREDQLWKKVQTAVTSQQSRTMLRDQIRTCFQELQLEDEDKGCSYSNKLERCLMLRFSDRKLNGGKT